MLGTGVAPALQAVDQVVEGLGDAGSEGLVGGGLEDPARRPRGEHRQPGAAPLLDDLAPGADDLEAHRAVLLGRGPGPARRGDGPGRLQGRHRPVGEGEGGQPPVLDLDVPVDEVGHLGLHLLHLASGQPAHLVDGVDALVDERAPGHLRGSANQPGRPERYQSSAMDQREVACMTDIVPMRPASRRSFRAARRRPTP